MDFLANPLPAAMTHDAELFAEYAQKVVEGLDIEDLMDAVKESIELRLADLPVSEALEEIDESEYSATLAEPIAAAYTRNDLTL
ncbi:DUF7326 family protein [Vreelandella massiliensis]|uniref:DUF7326 family protein n=1 Tax=Vreelandella massiliensis TaxID=1816686 RepID=UPI00096ABBA9|nr:hypothetical protein [Halomonas massiliensis]